ncbi:MAG TPA: hypothetical protein VFS12_13945 [Terriglobia bacterium]|nr:hypothetical protein [Terriglobia bacterium]
MKPGDDERIEKILREAIPPLAGAELRRDLWPLMRRRLEERSFTVSWRDWSLIVISLIWLVAFPEVIPALVYHL